MSPKIVMSNSASADLEYLDPDSRQLVTAQIKRLSLPAAKRLRVEPFQTDAGVQWYSFRAPNSLRILFRPLTPAERSQLDDLPADSEEPVLFIGSITTKEGDPIGVVSTGSSGAQ
jgi:hypothetical protein